MTWPFDNDTGKVVKKLAKRSLKARKNTVAVLAILLSALLFTGLFTVVMDLNAAYEQSTMRAMGTCAHAGLKHATVEEYEALAADDRWADAFYAETSFCMPMEGRMPEAEDEIAASPLIFLAGAAFTLLTVFVS